MPNKPLRLEYKNITVIETPVFAAHRMALIHVEIKISLTSKQR